MVPTSSGNPTPAWDLASFVSFMEEEHADKAIISFSEPSANIHLGNKSATVALARLMNEQAAAYCAAYPDRFKFNAVVPLPYVSEAIAEAQYAIQRLGAAGIFLTSNFEGTYLGNAIFKPFFQALDEMDGKKMLSVHPGPPYIKYEDQYVIDGNPTTYPIGTVEFYFETARTLMDLTLSGYLLQFTSINYIVPYAGGAFPATIDRILRPSSPVYNSSLQIFQNRFWWDTAGLTFDHQVESLLSYGIPKSQLVFGSVCIRDLDRVYEVLIAALPSGLPLFFGFRQERFIERNS
ncbi:2-amino-3-carboxymuconate-6-semialdehyde decarboxylase [Leucoagaricus sp. SymC.cos]|nr:2-amino-3-carboxymuconate-6-semialdehyde decarboxylase [Leucoagaricus sp. SymC.cos]